MNTHQIKREKNWLYVICAPLFVVHPNEPINTLQRFNLLHLNGVGEKVGGKLPIVGACYIRISYRGEEGSRLAGKFLRFTGAGKHLQL